ncbi:MAG: nucleotidyltransferase family protein [Archangiaceae bacterium]|nr:nucleotidyltransferase family protein [Archangiaceae bacterium]
MADVIVILAAGEASRFGSPKQLAEWRGRPLVRFVTEEALAACSDVVVVIGAHAPLVRDALAGLACRIVENLHWQRGPGSSLKAALDTSTADGVLVTLVDLPQVTREHLTRLLKTEGPLVASRWRASFGAPAMFRAPFIEALKRLDDGAGAKSVLQANRSQVTFIDCPEAALDVDDRETLESLRQQTAPRR